MGKRWILEEVEDDSGGGGGNNLGTWIVLLIAGFWLVRCLS